MKRYEAYLARLDPVHGSEMGKTRPVVIVSDDLRNQTLQTVVACLAFRGPVCDGDRPGLVTPRQVAVSSQHPRVKSRPVRLGKRRPGTIDASLGSRKVVVCCWTN